MYLQWCASKTSSRDGNVGGNTKKCNRYTEQKFSEKMNNFKKYAWLPLHFMLRKRSDKPIEHVVMIKRFLDSILA